MITKCSTVSLIGISWGGAVCIFMAQMLEADNMAVSLTLLDGIPNVLQEWTSSLRQYGNFNSKLILNYFQFSSVVIIFIKYIIFDCRLIDNGNF